MTRAAAAERAARRPDAREAMRVPWPLSASTAA